jgi:uncharacterized protein
MTQIYVDADGCPVKQEVCKVAKRYEIAVTFVANSQMRIAHEEGHRMVVVDGSRKLDAADDWIAEQAAEGDIVITADIPLAARCLARGAVTLDIRGGAFTQESIGHALAGRELMSQLRAMDAVTGGPPPFEKRDRSRFLQRLDETIHALRKRKPPEA